MAWASLSVASMYLGVFLMRSLQVMCVEFLQENLAPGASKPGQLHAEPVETKENSSCVSLWTLERLLTTAPEKWLILPCWQAVLPTSGPTE